MERGHRHNEVELNFAVGGSTTYLFGGRQVCVPAGVLAVFWAAFPHRIVAADADTELWWLTIPLATVLAWQLPRRFAVKMLRGLPITDPTMDEHGIDRGLMRQWHEDLRHPLPEHHHIVVLEVEARLRRLCLCLDAESAASARGAVPRGETVTGAEAMALYIAGHFHQPVRVADLAAAAGMQPNYAMELFRRTFGVSMITYLTQFRLADAQRLLATTDATATEIAMAVGFGSTSRFYEAFKTECGQSPLSYRKAVQRGSTAVTWMPLGAAPAAR